MKLENQNITIYQSNDGKISFNVNVFEDTVWLTQKQMAELFDTTVQNVGQHIKLVYEDEELGQNRTVKKFFIVQIEGSRSVKREVEHYNLDMIISVGYRVQSKRATQFRIWATSILKQYLLNGYAINESRIKAIEEKIDNLSTELKAEFRAEIREIHKDLLKVANRPITINNQIRIGSDKLENKIVEILDELISQIKSDKKLKSQLEEIKEIIKISPKDQETQNKIKRFFKEMGDDNSDLHKTIKGLGIAKKIITELVKLGMKFKGFIS